MENNIFDNYNLEFSLKIYPITFLGRTELEKGDKILLPPEILKKISDSDLKGPIVFEMKNHNSKRRSHCGVMEFTADEGCAYLPRWMMQNLDVKEGEKVQFSYANLEKGNYVKLQPQTDDFLEISNPKAVLEAKLRFFTCLTKLDIIAIEYNNKIYWINVVEVKPGNAVSIIDTDIDVEFAPPVINKLPDRQNTVENSTEFLDNNKVGITTLESEELSSEENDNKQKPFKGKGHIAK